MFINFHFYNSETDILTGGSSFYGLGCRLDPSDSIQEFRFSIEIPWNIQSMWVKVYFDQPFGEPPSVIRSISIGQGISFELLGIEISLIIEG